MIQKMKTEFLKIFGKGENPKVYFAPGRINLIGEHIDYNGGFVLPAAISYGTYMVVRKRTDNKIIVSSLNFEEDNIISFNLHHLSYSKDDKWANYPKGIVSVMIENGYHISSGFEALYYGNIPNEAGLSSSASIEMVTAVMLKSMFDLNVTTEQLVKIAQVVENEFIGVNSGIMDQFAVGFGKKNHAILLNCETLDYEYAPIILNNYKIIIIHTNKKRTLSDSAYNERRAQCEVALTNLQSKVQINNLCDLTPKMFEQLKYLIEDEISLRRAHHAVYENARTKEAFQQLKKGNINRFGKLMNDSHASLRDYYEVTGPELDTIVSAAQNEVGVLGARMTGAGFGGCAIAIVENNKVNSFKENVNAVYKQTIGYDASFYVATVDDGIREVKGEVIK